jgi:hypothetical protein
MTTYYSDRVRPDVVRELLNVDNYEAFNLGIEHGPHLAMPRGVLGDILKNTAPYGQSLHRIIFFCSCWRASL